MTDSLIEMYDRGFERDSIIWIAVSRENWLKISDRVTQLRRELSLAEEGLANYAQEVEQLRASLERIQQSRLTWCMACPDDDCRACQDFDKALRAELPQSGLPSDSA